MPPDLARIVFIGFIIAVLVYDNRKEPYPSKGLLIPLVWFMLSGSKSVRGWLGQTPPPDASIDYTSGDPLSRAVLIVLMLLALFVLYKRHFRIHDFVKENKWVFYLFIYMGVSILWSDFEMVSIKRWYRSIGDLLMALVILTEVNPFLALQKTIRRTGFILITLSLLYIKYFRDIGVGYDYEGFTMWVGVTTHKNSLGQLACVMGLYFTWRLIFSEKRGPVDILFLFISVWILKGAGGATSKTSLIVYLLGVLTLIALKKIGNDPSKISKILMVVLILFLMTNVLVEILQNQSLIAFLITSSGGDMTLTGRTYLWSDLIQIGLSSPILGSGYGGFWVGDIGHDLWLKHTWKPGQAHNGYIDVFVNLGLVGLVLLVGFLAESYRRILINLRLNHAIGSFQLTFFTIILLFNITESSFNKPTSFLWVLFLLVVVGIPSGEFDEQGGHDNGEIISS